MATISGGVNLLPRLTKAELVKEQRRSTVTLGTAAITLLVSVISVILLLFNLYQKYSIEGTDLPVLKLEGLNGKIQQLNAQIDSNEDLLSVHTELATKLNFVGEIIANRPDYQRTLDRLQDLLPSEIEVKSYEINENYEVELSGISKDYFSIALFVNRAQKEDLTQGYFDMFTLESANLNEDRVNFTISAVAIFPEEETI